MIIGVVGMTGSGKSKVSDYLVSKGFSFLRLGQITLDIVKERGLEPKEENERPIREEMREKHGMAAYAVLNIPKIDELRKDNTNIVLDGLYSWEEYLEFKKAYGNEFLCLAVYSSPKERYSRLENRTFDPAKDKDMRFRPTTAVESQSRDYAEIENLHKAGPIAMADYTIINDGTIEELENRAKVFLESFLSM